MRRNYDSFALCAGLLPMLSSYQVAQASQEIDDASRLNATRVSEVIDIHSENDVKLALAKAQIKNLHISIAGRQHTMGGQTFEKDNIVLNMLTMNGMTYDAKTGILTVQAGATWAQVQKRLDPLGRSVWVMQSDNVFSVGGTLSANAHGWHVKQGPIASTVDSLKIMLASGEIKTCSLNSNPDLFRAALGGYGLLGVILEARLQTVPNRMYRQNSMYFSSDHYADRFRGEVADNPAVEMAYGRLSIDRTHFLDQAALHTFEIVQPQPSVLPAMADESMVSIKNSVFQQSAKSDAGKKRRWGLEKKLSRYEAGRTITRNTVMNPDFRVVWHPVPESHDILQEYFVPYDRVNAFVDALRTEVRSHDLNLLNVTLRDVRRDDVTMLAYAKADMCALVLFFSQPPTAQAEETMRTFTRSLVDRALALEGSFYLPYRLTYTTEQFRQAYPGWKAFTAVKHEADPEGRFTSRFYNFLISAHRVSGDPS